MDGDGAGDATSGSGRDETAGSEESPPVQDVDAGRSGLAAALLNLTGLGLGYLYLRRWLRATACLVIVALMVVVAFANDAASTPWLWRTLLVTWAVATAVDAWSVARRLPQPAPGRQALRPVALGVAAVLVVVGGHVGYAEAARATYAGGLAAQGRAECGAANSAFDAVTGPYELTLSRDVPAAALRRAECEAFLAAEGAERAGAHAEAVAGYQAVRRHRPDGVLAPFAGEGARRALGRWAVALRGSGDLGGAIARYRDLLEEVGGEPGAAQVREDLAASYVERAAQARATLPGATGRVRVDVLRSAMDDLLLVGLELGGTAAAAAVPTAVLDTFAAANAPYAAGRFCEALPVLDYAVTLPASAGLAGVANGDRARSLSECGLVEFAAGDYGGATERFEALLADYPGDPAVAQARSALITAEVGRSAGFPLPLPAPIDAPAGEPVLVYNTAASEVRVLLTGPTAHELVLPPCTGCPAAHPMEAGSCPGPAGMPSTTVRMRAGTYYVLQDRAELGPDEPVDQPLTIQPGGGWELCVTVTRN
jgi:tetratricopeptide (TPR) repeat protein